MSAYKTDKGKDKSNSKIIETDINPEVTLSNMSQQPSSPKKGHRIPEQNKVSSSLFPEKETQEPSYSSSESPQDKGGQLIKIEAKTQNKAQGQSIFQQVKATTTAILVGTVVMLPILAVGTATYYFGNQAINKQAIFLARRLENRDLAEAELARQQKLLAALLIGTGTTALLAGAIAAFGTKRLIDAISKISTEKTEKEAEPEVYREFVPNLSQSVPQKNILQAIVEEARNYLKCDRVVVYSLNQDQYGVIVAESVAPGYTQALGKTIEDPCFEAKYLDKYRDGRVRAIDNIYEAKMTPCHLAQLEQLEVKANLVTPISNEGKLFGLLVAHQCAESHQWQKTEIELLNQLATKVALLVDNASLLNDVVRLKIRAKTERTWTNYFTDAIQHIRQSLKQDDILEISVEEVRRVLECDRVVVYSLNQDNYGVVVAESVAPG
ncbi:MAG: GAF domain-containing protein, partial [Xenococcaceae cyanobacterium MO_207.B15]|nr:GAF domain-containing protein [Xenococcaceae cyanobacterium MO_207.B15]